MSKCSKKEGKVALAQADREIDGAFKRIQIGAIIMIVCFVGLVATVAYGMALQLLK